MNRRYFGFVFSVFLLLASYSYSENLKNNVNEKTAIEKKEVVPLEKIRKELDVAQSDFERAKKMFNPWYAGPLITGSAHTLDPGLVNIQPYLYVFDNFALYDSKRHAHDIKKYIVVNPTATIQTGIFKWLDVTLGLQGYYKQREGVSSGNIGDTSLSFGIQLIRETEYIPAVKLALSESFPTGKYRNLKPHKAAVDSSGNGSFVTGIGLNFGKVIWWWLTHPLNVRLASKYSIYSDINVKNFNAYGGGYGTKGHVKTDGIFTADLGLELSLTQKVVIALDVCYEYDKKFTFKGKKGFTIDNEPAETGSPMSDVLSLAPALEYNFTPDIALIGGAWFSVYGKNAFDFACGIITFTATF